MAEGRLQGEVAIITGSGARGTGTAIARHFVQEGAKVVVTGRNVETGEGVAKELQNEGGDAVFIRADLAERDQVEALVQGAVDAFGSLTVLVNNMGGARMGGGDGAIADVQDDAWNFAIQVNLTGFMYICRAAVPHMLAAGHGAIVNITSRTALRGCPGLSAYTAVKGAQEALTRAMAMDYGRQGIRVNSIAPGYIMEKEKLAGNAVFEERAQHMLPMHLTRMPTVDDIAAASVYLASDESGSTTGVCIPIDSGGSAVRGATLG
jgi:NAD(P)-dependent dehydrogenase (short-subunit alcohol dehydrogenase family)